jgi:hypothetical protein
VDIDGAPLDLTPLRCCNRIRGIEEACPGRLRHLPPTQSCAVVGEHIRALPDSVVYFLHAICGRRPPSVNTDGYYSCVPSF